MPIFRLLKQITIAWHYYLENNNETFYQGINTNHNFGGWIGVAGLGSYRPLNKYVDIPLTILKENNAELFHCPDDGGGVFGYPPKTLAYQIFGNSYQTNIMLIGPTQIGPVPANLTDLRTEVNKHLKNLKLSKITTRASLLSLVGDNNWMPEWDPMLPHNTDWHDRLYHHNLAFLDGHVDFIKIRKGLWVTQEYTVLPFRNLLGMARRLQQEVE